MLVEKVKGKTKVRPSSTLYQRTPQSPQVGVSFTTQGYINSRETHIQQVIFRQNTLSHPSFCKVFFPEKCMNMGWDWKCGGHASFTTLQNPFHDSRFGISATYPCFPNSP